VHEEFRTKVQSDAPKGWPFKTHQATYHPKYTASLREAKITLNVNHYPTLYKAYTRRTIRSLFARRCHITLYIPGMEEDFENHKDVVWFHTLGEGLDLIRYYLDHDAEREEIAWNGWRRAMEAHTFEHRLAEFEHAVGGAL
jgi:spore maturation protein CgeB